MISPTATNEYDHSAHSQSGTNITNHESHEEKERTEESKKNRFVIQWMDGKKPLVRGFIPSNQGEQ